MPKELTHWMLAERALAALPPTSRLKGIIEQHRNAYLGGAVLPDTLAHIFRGPFHPTARVLGHRFHDATANSYEPLIRTERRFRDGVPAELMSCLLGVISHMEADVALHPYVYAASGSDIGKHYRIETDIDVHFLQKGEAPTPRRLDRLLCPASRGAMVTAARHLFDPEEELPEEAMEQALELHCRFQGMYNRTLWKIAVRLLAKVCGAPFTEQRQLFYPMRKGSGNGDAEVKWRHPESGEENSASLDDLARQAVERTVAVFGRIEESGTLAAALTDPPGPNLLTGLHGVTKGA